MSPETNTENNHLLPITPWKLDGYTIDEWYDGGNLEHDPGSWYLCGTITTPDTTYGIRIFHDWKRPIAEYLLNNPELSAKYMDCIIEALENDETKENLRKRFTCIAEGNLVIPESLDAYEYYIDTERY